MSEKVNLAITVGVAGGETINLYVTDKRLVGLSKAINSDGKAVLVGAAFGGIIGAGIVKGVSHTLRDKKQKQEAEQELDPSMSIDFLDKALKADNNNFEILFEDVNWIQVNKSWIGCSLALETPDDKVAFEISKKQVELLSEILPSIALLDNKIKL